jgi:hypothetical protein
MTPRTHEHDDPRASDAPDELLDERWFPMEFSPVFRLASLPLGACGKQAGVLVREAELVARFGPWSISTPIDNIASAQVTGPYRVVKTIGPPHLSLRDLGLTFAGTPRRGVCLRFNRALSGIEPLGLIRHPALTVTVREPEELVWEIRRRLELADPEVLAEIERIDQEAHDELESMTARELREVAAAEGLESVASRSKAELVDLIEATEYEHEHASGDR